LEHKRLAKIGDDRFDKTVYSEGEHLSYERIMERQINRLVDSIMEDIKYRGFELSR